MLRPISAPREGQEPGVFGQCREVQLGPEDDKEQRYEEALGDPAHLCRQTFGPTNRGDHETCAKTGDQHAGPAFWATHAKPKSTSSERRKSSAHSRCLESFRTR